MCKQEVKQYDYFSTEYGNEKMTWIIYSMDNNTTKNIPDCVLLGEEGEQTVDKIKDRLFVLCKPSSGVSQWNKWKKSIAEKLENKGVQKGNIKQAIIEILFEHVKKYKESIIIDENTSQNSISYKKRNFYFLAQFDDSL